MAEAMHTPVREVDTLFPEGGYAPSGEWREIGRKGQGHPADGMTLQVSLGGGAYSTIINPRSFADGGPEWVMRYGNVESIRYSVASLLETFDYLLSESINGKEAIRRLRVLRAVRRDAIGKAEGQANG